MFIIRDILKEKVTNLVNFHYLIVNLNYLKAG